MKIYFKIISLITLISILQSCTAVDLRSNYLMESNETRQLEEKGRKLLETSYLKMGYDKLSQTEVYEATAQFHWRGFWLMMPMNAFPGNNKNDVQFRFATNTFDGQLEYLEGRKKEEIQGVQSWNGYKTEKDSDFLKRHEHDRYIWGLATYHYLIEAPMRLRTAEIIRYAGEKDFDGESYDLVYVTWGTEEPNKEFDRWLLYINKATGFIDLTEVTINDFFLPMPKGIQHATIRSKRKLTSIGAYMPIKSTIQLKSPKKEDTYVYYFTLQDYKFDSFDKQKLYPLENIPFVGDAKPESE